MHYDLSDERTDFLAARGRVVLSACPGSGKTTSVAYKLTGLIKDWEKQFGRYQGIACLSFTNVAKDEIEEKFACFCGNKLGFPHLVSTLDSFINHYITLPFGHKILPDCQSRLRIIDNNSFMDDWYFHDRLPQSTQLLKFSYCPSSIDICFDGTYRSKQKRPAIGVEDLKLFDSYCKKVKSKQHSYGLLTNSDSTYFALRILKEFPEVAQALVTRFPYILVDEAQDTSEIQYAILEEFIKNGLKNIELIGDPYQSLYQWRDAKPDLFIAKSRSDEWNHLTFTACRRSTKTIVDCYCKLRSTADPQLESIAIGIEQEPIQVILFDDYDLLVGKYEKLAQAHSNRKIVVRGESQLKKMSAFNEVIPLWKIDPCIPIDLIYAKYELSKGNVKYAINRVRKNLPVLIKPETIGDYKGQKELLDEISDDYTWNARIIEMISKIPSFDLSVIEWTILAQQCLKEAFQLSFEPQFALKAGIHTKCHKNPMSELFGDAVNSTKVTTVHQVKGKTFDSLMLVLNENSSGQSISIKDLSEHKDVNNEKTRIIYVAMSRPRVQLVIAIPKKDLEEKYIKDVLGDDSIIHII